MSYMASLLEVLDVDDIQSNVIRIDVSTHNQATGAAVDFPPSTLSSK
jgi:hypothetical protein